MSDAERRLYLSHCYVVSVYKRAINFNEGTQLFCYAGLREREGLISPSTRAALLRHANRESANPSTFSTTHVYQEFL
jgi:hypothetical protein